MAMLKNKVLVPAVAVYTDFRLDESYTPSKISVRCGTNFNDLQEIEVVELTEPSGWVVVPLKDLNDRLVRSFMIQIAVTANHQQVNINMYPLPLKMLLNHSKLLPLTLVKTVIL